MSIYVESKYAGETGLCMEVTECQTAEEVLTCVQEAMSRDDWSDSVLVDETRLPEPARETWQERAR